MTTSNQKPMEIVFERQVIGALWCVECSENVYATYIYYGKSLCKKHIDELHSKEVDNA